MTPLRSYPLDLAARVRESWPRDAEPLPACLERVLDVAYHASFLRDEERPVTCRIVVTPPGALEGREGPPQGLLPLVFLDPRAFDEHEIRRLSPAAKYHRALIGVEAVGAELRTWGIVQSGPRWLQNTHGGRREEPTMPSRLIIRVVRPGHVVASCGHRLVAELRGGKINDFALDMFSSRWLPNLFVQQRKEIAEQSGVEDRARVADLARMVAQQMLKRVIAIMRSAHHGGLILCVPPDCTPTQFLDVKYPFAPGDARRHYRRLVLSILDDLRKKHRSELEEGLFELSHLIASLADVDGAVLLTKRFEILGFGAEIQGNLPPVTEVRKAFDLEGEHTELEAVDGVGTRHRAAYRLCAAVPDALAIVVSQDGGVRFVSSHAGSVTYWDHEAGDE